MSGEDTAEIMDTFREGLADKTTVFLAPASVSSERLIYFIFIPYSKMMIKRI